VSRLIGVMLMLFSGALAQDPAPPLPPPRPERLAEPQPEGRAEKVPRNENPLEKAGLGGGARDACLQRLTQLGLHFESRPPVKENSCGIENPVLVSALPDGVAVVPASLMACPLAESITRWMSETVAPEA
jgi:hypothetical protein